MVDEGGLVVAWQKSGTVKSILGCGERPCQHLQKELSNSFELLCYNTILQMQLRNE